jgi:hypothetical protein
MTSGTLWIRTVSIMLRPIYLRGWVHPSFCLEALAQTEICPNQETNPIRLSFSPRPCHCNESECLQGCVLFYSDRCVPLLQKNLPQPLSYHGNIKSWKQIPAGLLASFPSKIKTFIKRVENVVTSKGVQVGIECK